MLSRLYHQVAEAQEPQFAAGYDLDVGLDRYQAWLRERTRGRSQRDAWSAKAA